MNANYENSHIDLMRSILTQLRETPLVLKGGTALMLCYDLDRFSEDLDFDAPKKLNLESKIKSSIPSNLDLVQILVLKNTDTVTRYRVRYRAHDVERSLKIEVSYRTPVPLNQVNFIRAAVKPRPSGRGYKAVVFF
ncbi:hypothetical protein CL689_07045 [Candidatus Saccharibacteria bacterium]|nr:hypothetical protein [Candidatus Saccharibacteria bacterium]|tara:strand:- start:703 stop:1110 length:408 start_codon:yes stop_codon:yes gene_type:complete